jgi:hypothetical protein
MSAASETKVPVDAIDEVPEPERFGRPPPPGPHPLTRPRIFVPILVLLFVLNLPFLHLMLRGPAAVTTKIPFTDDYSRTELGNDYFSTGGLWRIVNGEVYSPGVKNNPLWLKAKLPHDVVAEFDVRSESSAGDVKCEIFGNGRDHSSGYILVFGGWNNTISVIARLDEHGPPRDITAIRPTPGALDWLLGGHAPESDNFRMERKDRRVEKGRTYHWKVVREGSVLSWYIDGDLFMTYDDPKPLYGPDHDRFGFGTWATDGFFDNLVIRPLH